MDIEVYCDESNPEVLWDRNAAKYFVLGSIWMPKEYRETFKEKVKVIKSKHNYFYEIKWNKVSPSSIELYLSLIDFFFSEPLLRFRGMPVEANRIDSVQFQRGDHELSFYKFYYQLIHHWIKDYNNYSLFVDHKMNKDKGRVNKLNEVLQNANMFSSIENVQAIHSDESLGIQLADFLTGALNAKVNGKTTSAAKLEVIRRIEEKLGHEIKPTGFSEAKFNVFKINLRGGL